MLHKALLSPVEHKILITIALLICSFYFINVSNKIIDIYNETVINEQIEKQKAANNEKNISFGFSHCYSTPLYELILALQFFTIPLLYFSLRKQSFKAYLFSLFLSGFTLFGYICWMIDTYIFRKASERFVEENITFNTFILYQSTILEFALFLTFGILFIVQSGVLLRFVIEKFQVKIS